MRRICLRAALTLTLVFGFAIVYYGAATAVDSGMARSVAIGVDARIPFVPEAVFVYVWVYSGALLPLFTVRSDHLLVHIALAYTIVLSVLLVSFVAWPVSTQALRASAGSLDPTRFSEWGVALLYHLDPPVNSFPSGHVAFSTVAALAARRVWSRYGIPAALWWTAIAISTCLTKQHYVVDVVAGALLGAFAYAVALRGVNPGPDEVPLHYGWRGPTLQLVVHLLALRTAYALFASGFLSDFVAG